MTEPNLIDVNILLSDGTAVDYREIQYVSWVNHDTYGIPALIAEDGFKQEVKEDGDSTVLYINPENVVAVKATRKDS